jgi:hypothetical protein
MRQNTLNLVGDGDELDMVRDAENAFEIKLAGSELTAIRSVGDLYDLIFEKYRSGHPASQACLSQAAFYRLRSALGAMGVAGPIAPAASVSNIFPERHVRRWWRELARRSGLTLPPLEVRWMASDVVLSRPWAWMANFAIGSSFILAAAVIVKLTGMTFGWALLAAFSSFLAMILVSAILPLWFGEIPRRIETIGDLAREAAGYSFKALRREKRGCSRADLWPALFAMLREISGRAGKIDRETTFFARSSPPAS